MAMRSWQVHLSENSLKTPPWVHLDIAGTATTEKPSCFGPTGATGVMVRSLATFVERFEPKK